MSETGTDFAKLVHSVRTGDNHALDQLMKIIGPPLQRTARRLIGKPLKPHLDPVDLVQLVSIILWQGLRKGKFEIATPKSLLALSETIMRRVVARHWRILKPMMSSTLDGSLGGTLTDKPLVARESTHSSHAHDGVSLLLSQLEDVDRRLLGLRLQGHNTSQAARKMGVDPAFLRVRLSRLRKRFRHIRAGL